MRRMVMGSANHWGGPVTTGTQQYGRLFAEAGWKVAYLSDPVSPYHLLRPKSWLYNRQKFALWMRGGEWHLDRRLYAYNHMSLLPVFNAPILRSPLAVQRSLDLSVPSVMAKLAREGFGEPDLVWIDHLVFESLPARLRGRMSIYRMADEPELFPEPYPPALLRRLPALLRRVDLVIATARRIEERVRGHRDEGVLYLPNGVDYPHFSAPREEPRDLASIPRPRALYVGSLEPWFDTELVATAAGANPSCSFVIIGPVRISLGALKTLPNVHVLGPRSYADAPAYMAHADVGLIPFRTGSSMEAVHPIKVYEYLAAGLPVVSTAWEELRLMGAPIQLAASGEDFIDAIRAVLERPGDGAPRRGYARENSWASRFAVLDTEIRKRLGP